MLSSLPRLCAMICSNHAHLDYNLMKLLINSQKAFPGGELLRPSVYKRKGNSVNQFTHCPIPSFLYSAEKRVFLKVYDRYVTRFAESTPNLSPSDTTITESRRSVCYIFVRTLNYQNTPGLFVQLTGQSHLNLQLMKTYKYLYKVNVSN